MTCMPKLLGGLSKFSEIPGGVMLTQVPIAALAAGARGVAVAAPGVGVRRAGGAFSPAGRCAELGAGVAWRMHRTAADHPHTTTRAVAARAHPCTRLSHTTH